jgi:hypothetical protein
VAVKLVSAIALNAEQGIKKGDEVTVDGLPGRGMVMAVKGSRATIRYRNGMWLSRDVRYLHSLANYYKSDYTSLKAGEIDVEREAAGTIPAKSDSIVEQVGTQFCVRSPDSIDNNFGCYPSKEEAEDKKRYIR